jgi:hypothetical protein
MAKVNLITQKEYATRRGCSAVAVHKAVKAGRISLIDGLIDPDVADIQWAKNSRARIGSKPMPAEQPGEESTRLDSGDLLSPDPASQPERPDTPPPDDYTTWRGRREAADAELAELRLAEQRRDLISVAAVEGVWSAMLASAREHLLQVRARLAPVLAAESDVFKIEQMLEAEHRKALETLASAEVRKMEPGQ